MRISRVFIDTDLAEGGVVTLGKPQSHYLQNVLRLKPGAALILFNGREAAEYSARLSGAGKQAEVNIGSRLSRITESALDSEIIQGLGRADHVDWALQKCTELGVARFTIFTAARSQGILKPAQVDRKLDHWRGVAISACEQSGRTRLPQIEFHPGLAAVLARPRDGLKLMLKVGGEPLHSIQTGQAPTLSILLGPEGGLDDAEIAAAEDNGFAPVGLGPRVLRTETAAVAALAIAQSAIGDM